MTPPRWFFLIAGLAAGGLAVGLTLWLTRGGAKPPPSHEEYALLFRTAARRQSQSAVLKRWPEPYNTYHDGGGNRCYEWFDKGVALYNLCFKNGKLFSKELA